MEPICHEFVDPDQFHRIRIGHKNPIDVVRVVKEFGVPTPTLPLRSRLLIHEVSDGRTLLLRVLGRATLALYSLETSDEGVVLVTQEARFTPQVLIRPDWYGMSSMPPGRAMNREPEVPRFIREIVFLEGSLFAAISGSYVIIFKIGVREPSGDADKFVSNPVLPSCKGDIAVEHIRTLIGLAQYLAEEPESQEGDYSLCEQGLLKFEEDILDVSYWEASRTIDVVITGTQIKNGHLNPTTYRVSIDRAVKDFQQRHICVRRCCEAVSASAAHEVHPSAATETNVELPLVIESIPMTCLPYATDGVLLGEGLGISSYLKLSHDLNHSKEKRQTGALARQISGIVRISDSAVMFTGTSLFLWEGKERKLFPYSTFDRRWMSYSCNSTPPRRSQGHYAGPLTGVGDFGRSKVISDGSGSVNGMDAAIRTCTDFLQGRFRYVENVYASDREKLMKISCFRFCARMPGNPRFIAIYENTAGCIWILDAANGLQPVAEILIGPTVGSKHPYASMSWQVVDSEMPRICLISDDHAMVVSLKVKTNKLISGKLIDIWRERSKAVPSMDNIMRVEPYPVSLGSSGDRGKTLFNEDMAYMSSTDNAIVGGIPARLALMFDRYWRTSERGQSMASHAATERDSAVKRAIQFHDKQRRMPHTTRETGHLPPFAPSISVANGSLGLPSSIEWILLSCQMIEAKSGLHEWDGFVTWKTREGVVMGLASCLDGTILGGLLREEVKGDKISRKRIRAVERPSYNLSSEDRDRLDITLRKVERLANFLIPRKGDSSTILCFISWIRTVQMLIPCFWMRPTTDKPRLVVEGSLPDVRITAEEGTCEPQRASPGYRVDGEGLLISPEALMQSDIRNSQLMVQGIRMTERRYEFMTSCLHYDVRALIPEELITIERGRIID